MEDQTPEKPWLFQKGQSGNPKGRPLKRDSIRDMLREELAGSLTLPDGREVTKAQIIAMKAFALAAQGDMVAIKYLSDQVDGTPKQSVELSGSEGGAIETRNETRITIVRPPKRADG